MRRSMRHAILSAAAAAAVCLGALLAPAPARADYLGFADVSPSDWAAEQGYIAYVASEGLMSGLGDGTFGQAEPLSRAQVATVLWRAAGSPAAPEGAARFPDCDYSDGSFYGRAVSWARAAGVVSGYEDGRFGPADPVTREQLATMLARHASRVAGLDASSDGSALAAMADASSVTLWDGMAWAVDAGVLTGDLSTGEPLALPQRPAQRDQAAKMFAVFHRDVLGEGGAPGEPDFDAPTDVEYTSDVVDASVSEVDVRDDGMTVALEGSEADVQVGDIVMIDPTEELPFGSAVKVEEVSSSGGVTTVEGVVPEPAEVYDSVIINEEYDKEDLLAGGASLQSIELTDEGISIDEDLGVYGKVTGSLTINDFEGHAFVFVPPGLLAKYFGYVDVDFEADLTVDLDFSISALPSNLKKIRLGSPIPLPYCGVPGWGLNVVFYLNTDVSGHIIVTTDIQMSTSAHRDLIGDIDQTTKSSTRTFDSVSIAVDGKIGPSAVVALMLLDEPVFDVGAEFGAAAKVESTQHPGLTCGDAAIWLYGEAFAEFVGEMADSAKVTATIFDEDNSPLEMGIHVENGELVPECTWDPGADEEPDVGDPSNPGGEGTDNPNDPENPETPEGPTTDASDFTYVIGDGVEYGNLYGTASYGYGAYITGYKGSSSDVVIPASIDGIDVLYVGISDAGRRIKSLDFSHAKSLRDINLYIGEYDVNFGKLDELERVAATLTCRFTGDFDLSQCGSLKHLIFSDGASLGGFMRFGTESLETISIGITNIAGTFTIGDAPRLREAEFVDVGISDIIFGNCPSLEKLTVINTDITNLDVSGFPQLNELTCFDNNISDTSALEAWASQPGHTANLVGYDAGLLSERK